MVIAIIAVALVGVAVWASADVGSGVWVRTLCRARRRDRVVALTFDDGPHPDRTPVILDILARHGAEAAFFVIGERAVAHPGIVQRMVDEGHAVGNHTFGHRACFPLAGAGSMRRDIEECSAVITRITGRRPQLFRPPFGVTNPSLARALGGGYTVAGWSVRSLDTVSRWSRERVFRRVRRRLRPGAVVLLHDDREGGDRLLEMILTHIESAGYRVERFDKMFNM
jgi:peptidoglycan/xylan/chitin deacetylase (PgdA/CDA1 family)